MNQTELINKIHDARAKFHGLLAAVYTQIRGEGNLNILNLTASLQEGNHILMEIIERITKEGIDNG